ncbi:MAG: hypothetical protein H7832_15105 [Magnetococcus sp. DMHC-6]
MLITGQELTSLQALTFHMAESYGLDSRIDRYQGKGIDDIKTTGQAGYGSYGTSDMDSLNRLLQRLKDEETAHYGPDP